MKTLHKMLICCIFFAALVSMSYGSAPNLKLPFESGESWGVTNGYSDGYHVGKDAYALDFNLGGWDDLGKPILAVAPGIVKSISFDYDGYGWYVILDHGDGYESRYAHLILVTVKENDSVVQGQHLGLCGNTGQKSSGSHLHFVMYKDGNAYKPEPMSGYVNFTSGNQYVSNNTLIGLKPTSLYSDGFNQNGSSQAVADCYNLNGGPELIGQPYSDNGNSIYIHS